MKFGGILKPASSAADAKKQKSGKIKEYERKGGREEKKRGEAKRGGYRSPSICEIPFSPPPLFFLEIPLNDIDHLCPIVDNL